MRPVCRKNEPLIYKFHHLSAAIYAAVLFLFALEFRHPLYLLTFLFVVFSAAFLAGGGRMLKGYFIFAAWMIVPIVFINGLFSSSGETILWRGVFLPALGEIIITKEAIFYGLVMGLKILLTAGIFCFYQAASDIDEIFSFGLKTAPKCALMVMAAFSLVPRAAKDLAEIKDAMTARGVDFGGRSFVSKIKTYFPLWRVLLLNYLEGSWFTAQSLEMRAFNTGKRSFYPSRKWLRRDYVLAGGCLFSFIIFILGARGDFRFYPAAGSLFYKRDLFFLLLLFFGMSAVFLVPAGQKLWKFSISKN